MKKNVFVEIFKKIFRRPQTFDLCFWVLPVSMLILMGCVGEFTGGAPVCGVSYQTETLAGKTDESGRFQFNQGETVTFAIGDLVLGSATGNLLLSPKDFSSKGDSSADQKAINISILLQSLDEDGHLNNGIQITKAISAIAGGYDIDFNQAPQAFVSDHLVLELLAQLNEAGVFTDLDGQERTLKSALAAKEQLDRSLSDRNTVKTANGALKGYAADENTWQYLGIPYAKPPIGALRWRPPQAPKVWKDIRQATAWEDQAAQNPALKAYGQGDMSEDCLYLNVTAPKNAVDLPVMVWFHGGGFTALTSNSQAYNNPAGPPAKKVILVTVNHRLGPFGYMAHPELSAESEYGGSGNYGQMDLIAALKWVKKNIGAFGGDADNVTIFGESGGGRKVLSLMASPKAAGLFHKAISQSGTLIPDTRSLEDAESYGAALSESLGGATLADLRAMNWLDLYLASQMVVVPYTNVDGWYLPDTERGLIEGQKHNDVPFMILVNTNDTPDPINTWENVLPWLTRHSFENHYACLFTKVPSGWAAKGITAYHAAELAYLFNYPESIISHYNMGLVTDPATGESMIIEDLNGNGISGTDGDSEDILASAGWNSADEAVAETIMTLWTNFAAGSDPSIPGVFDWTPYTTENDTYLELGETLTLKTGLVDLFP